MKRWISWTLVFALLFSAVALSEGISDEDEIQPVNTAEIETEQGESVPLDIAEESDPASDIRILQYGMEGEDILALQQKLTELEYYSGNLSGRFREGTRAAVKKFQQEHDLEVTGIADEHTQKLIMETRYRLLQYGSSGENVKKLQTRLTELGYYKGKISGNYLEGSQYGIKLFQEKAGLEVTGVADPETQEAIYRADAPGRYDDDSMPTPSPTPQFENYLVDENATGSEAVMPDETVAYTRKLQYGDSGKAVKKLQTRMTELGYYTGPISGSFQGNTRNAVKKIQTQNAMTANGVVDEATWNLIFNDVTIVMPDATAKPTPEPTPVPFAITVDVKNQVTTVYTRDENGEYTVVVRQMLCSTGTTKNPSDVGDWVLSGRHTNWCVFPQWGNSYARYWTKINSSIAFHSVLYTAVDTKALKVSSYTKLGNRASHGCIRLTVADAKWIYDNVGKGTVVTITEDLPEDPELKDSLKLAPLNTKTMLPEETPQPTAEPEYVSGQMPPQPFRTLQKGSTGEDVYWLQCKLKELGYYNGKCSGTYLGGTQKAVYNYKKDNKLANVNQVADLNMLKHLYAAELATETPVPEATPAPAQ